jgi:hypothetical protein
MIAITTGPLIVPMMMIGQAVLMIRLQVGLMTVVGLVIEEAVHGIAGVVPIGIAKLGL